MVLTVTLLGGESTGKSCLAHALQRQLGEQGIPALLVPEHLRHWCEVQGRTPTATEQAALAAEQARQIDQAAASPGHRVVIADTSPLLIAAYSEHYFNDFSLYEQGVTWQRRAGLTLLMGLDLPWVADGLFRDSAGARDAIDAALRRQLHAHQLPFQTIYGRGDARTRQALRAIGAALGQSLAPDDAAWPLGRRPWNCEKCSDPDCEHRLFTQLLQQRPKET